jgi:hypothetical protein
LFPSLFCLAFLFPACRCRGGTNSQTCRRALGSCCLCYLSLICEGGLYPTSKNHPAGVETPAFLVAVENSAHILLSQYYRNHTAYCPHRSRLPYISSAQRLWTSGCGACAFATDPSSLPTLYAVFCGLSSFASGEASSTANFSLPSLVPGPWSMTKRNRRKPFDKGPFLAQLANMPSNQQVICLSPSPHRLVRAYSRWSWKIASMEDSGIRGPDPVLSRQAQGQGSSSSHALTE